MTAPCVTADCGRPSVTLPAISLHQPWASLLFADPPAKIHETRHWPAPFRVLGLRVAVHAAQRAPARDLPAELEALCASRFGRDWRRTLPRGAFVGTAVVETSTRMGFSPGQARPLSDADCITGDWTPGRFAWRLGAARRLLPAIQARGQQGWWTAEIPEDLL